MRVYDITRMLLCERSLVRRRETRLVREYAAAKNELDNISAGIGIEKLVDWTRGRDVRRVIQQLRC